MITMCLSVLRNEASTEITDHNFLMPGHKRIEFVSDHEGMGMKSAATLLSI